MDDFISLADLGWILVPVALAYFFGRTCASVFSNTLKRMNQALSEDPWETMQARNRALSLELSTVRNEYFRTYSTSIYPNPTTWATFALGTGAPRDPAEAIAYYREQTHRLRLEIHQRNHDRHRIAQPQWVEALEEFDSSDLIDPFRQHLLNELISTPAPRPQTFDIPEAGAFLVEPHTTSRRPVTYGELAAQWNGRLGISREEMKVVVAPEGVDLEPLRVAEGLCAICQTSIDGTICVCKECDTPHHQQCWTFNQQCGIFACRSLEKGPPPEVIFHA